MRHISTMRARAPILAVALFLSACSGARAPVPAPKCAGGGVGCHPSVPSRPRHVVVAGSMDREKVPGRGVEVRSGAGRMGAGPLRSSLREEFTRQSWQGGVPGLGGIGCDRIEEVMVLSEDTEVLDTEVPADDEVDEATLAGLHRLVGARHARRSGLLPLGTTGAHPPSGEGGI